MTASLDKSIIYWDVTTGQPVRRLRSHAGGVSCVRFNEDSSIAISGSKDNTVMCWDIRTRNLEPVQVMRDAKDCITSVVITDHKIISSSLDGTVRHYDLRAGEMVADSVGIPITYLVQTKDGQCSVAACQDGAIRLVDNDSGAMLNEYRGHKTDDYHIELDIFSSDQQIITGSTRGSIVIYDLLEGNEVQQLEMGGGVVHSLVTHPTGSSIACARRRNVHIWGIQEIML